MKNIEQYIRENLYLFNNTEPPQGHKGRFAQKLSKIQNRPCGNITLPRNHSIMVYHLSRVAISVAAVLIFVFTVQIPTKDDTKAHPDPISLLAQQEELVMEMIKKSNTYMAQQMANAVDNIMFEAIPLSELLPQELSIDQRNTILQNYYNTKAEGIIRVQKILACELTNN